MMNASKRRYLIGTGNPLLDIRNKYSTMAFSSDRVRLARHAMDITMGNRYTR
jgi:hypothetical protein